MPPRHLSETCRPMTYSTGKPSRAWPARCMNAARRKEDLEALHRGPRGLPARVDGHEMRRPRIRDCAP